MGLLSLGIDIAGNRITGVVLERQRKQLCLRACLSVPVPEEEGGWIAAVRQLCQQLDWREGMLVCGLPLTMLSVRSLTLPFKDSKKIAQALPFELEEQVLAPIDALITGFTVGKSTGTGTSIVAFLLAKEVLGNLLATLQGLADPDIVAPAMAVMAGQLARHHKVRPNVLLVRAEPHASALILVLEGRAVFCRRLIPPEQMLLHSPFAWEDGLPVVTDQEAAREAVGLFGRQIEQSLAFFRADTKEEGVPERVVLTGTLAGMEVLAEGLHSALGLPVEVADLLEASQVICQEPLRSQWRPQEHDLALAQALQGFQRAEINFRQGTFAKKRRLFSSKKQRTVSLSSLGAAALCLLGFLWVDYAALQQRDRALGEEMTALFRSTFPGVTKVQDPYVEMQARLKAAQGPASPAPIMSGKKRMLDLLAEISKRIPAGVALRVNRLHVDRETVAMKGTTDTFNAVEAIKSSLAASPRFKAVQIVSATADKDKKSGSIRFEIQLQVEGP